jgi:hypothetical protein
MVINIIRISNNNGVLFTNHDTTFNILLCFDKLRLTYIIEKL